MTSSRQHDIISTSCGRWVIGLCRYHNLIFFSEEFSYGLRSDFTSKLINVLAFGTPKFYIAPYDKIKHKLVNLSSNCDVKSGLNVVSVILKIVIVIPCFSACMRR